MNFVLLLRSANGDRETQLQQHRLSQIDHGTRSYAPRATEIYQEFHGKYRVCLLHKSVLIPNSPVRSDGTTQITNQMVALELAAGNREASGVDRAYFLLEEYKAAAVAGGMHANTGGSSCGSFFSSFPFFQDVDKVRCDHLVSSLNS